jgi:membrane protein
MSAQSPSRSSEGAPARQPQRFSGDDWKESLQYVRQSFARDRLSLVAPGVAFYLMFALVPALVALISIYGLMADPDDVREHFAAMEGAMPDEAHEMLQGQMDQIAGEQGAAGLGVLIGLLLALWSSSRATLALMEGLTVVYDAEEQRGMIKMLAVRLGLTIAAILIGVIAIAVIIVLPPLLGALPLPDLAITALRMSRWLLLAIAGLALLYHFGPDRRQPKMRWLSWG